jgi:hypothetical protein
MANNMSAQNEPIRMDLGDMVLISFSRFQSLMSVEADKEHYAQHIIEHQKNLSTAEAKLNELETQVDNLTRENEALKEAKVKPEFTKTTSNKKEVAPAKKSSPKKK